MTHHLNKSWDRVKQNLGITCLLAVLLVSCAKQPRRFSDAPSPAPGQAQPVNASPQRLNINTATERELKTLPGIGEQLAARIVAYRERNGPYRKPEQLLLVDGVSEGRLSDILPLITVE